MAHFPGLSTSVLRNFSRLAIFCPGYIAYKIGVAILCRALLDRAMDDKLLILAAYSSSLVASSSSPSASAPVLASLTCCCEFAKTVSRPVSTSLPASSARRERRVSTLEEPTTSLFSCVYSTPAPARMDGRKAQGTQFEEADDLTMSYS